MCSLLKSENPDTPHMPYYSSQHNQNQSCVFFLFLSASIKLYDTPRSHSTPSSSCPRKGRSCSWTAGLLKYYIFILPSHRAMFPKASCGNNIVFSFLSRFLTMKLDTSGLESFSTQIGPVNEHVGEFSAPPSFELPESTDVSTLWFA